MGRLRRWLMRRPRMGLAARLFTAQVLVVVTGSVTLSLVAAAIGPPIFHEHLHQIVGQVSAAASHHVEEAYTSASAISTGVGLLAALVAAIAVSAYVARRVAQPVEQLAAAAADLADGNATVRVDLPGLGKEFDTLASSFNAMAARVQSIEATRRRLLGDLGHEMRTPLATIEAYLDAVEDGITVDDEDTLSVLRTQTARLHRLAEDIAAVSRAEEHQLDLHPVRIAAADLVRTATAAASPRYAAKSVTLVSIVDAGPAGGDAAVDADPERMGQVLSNLLDNALRHTAPGGRVELRLGHDPAGVRLSVTDTGAGIDGEHLPHLFERFYRADTARDRGHGGSGIGLAIVRALVNGHGGRVTAASDGPGTGAVFTVTLPRSDSTVTLPRSATGAPPGR